MKHQSMNCIFTPYSIYILRLNTIQLKIVNSIIRRPNMICTAILAIKTSITKFRRHTNIKPVREPHGGTCWTKKCSIHLWKETYFVSLVNAQLKDSFKTSQLCSNSLILSLFNSKKGLWVSVTLRTSSCRWKSPIWTNVLPWAIWSAPSTGQ